MSCFFTRASLRPGSSASGLRIDKSSITASSIDMGDGNITSVGDPHDEGDAATKRYVDSIVDVRFAGLQVQLSGTAWTDVLNLRAGSYYVAVWSSSLPGAPTAAFLISRASDYVDSYATRLTAGPGVDTREMLEMRWPAGRALQLSKSGPGYDGTYIVDFGTKNLSTVTAPPEIPSDTATKDYVDHAIESRMNASFGGTVVDLQGTEYVMLDNLRPGSYIIAVSPLDVTNDGAPTATFVLSKSSVYDEAAVCRITGPPGHVTGERLELTWPSASLPRLRKDGPGYDGTYLVNLGLRNTASLPPPILPSDAATRDYVDYAIADRMKAQFGGVVVDLQGADAVAVCAPLRYGAYFVTVSPAVSGGPADAFVIGKGSSTENAVGQRLLGGRGVDTGETLELSWPAGTSMMLRKTLPFHDGAYVVDYNARNVTTTPAPVIPSDTATAEYVDAAVAALRAEKYAGINVELQGDAFTEVIASQPGCYLVCVSCCSNNTEEEGAPTACFVLAKNRSSEAGVVSRLVSLAATIDGAPTTEQLEMDWPANGCMRLRKTGPLFDGMFIVDFSLRNPCATTTAAAVNNPASDQIATRAYVADYVGARLGVKYGGEVVVLTGTSFARLVSDAASKEGARYIAISALVAGGPSAAFVVSKSDLETDGSITRIVDAPGSNGTGERLELSWPSGSALCVRKTGEAHDGRYLVDFNLRDFSSAANTSSTSSSLPPPPWPSTPTIDEMISDAVNRAMDKRFNGVTVSLTATEPVTALCLPPGSYFIAVSPCNSNGGGPSATFAASRTNKCDSMMIATLTSVRGAETGEAIVLSWGNDGRLIVSKTGSDHDGEYNVCVNAGGTPAPMSLSAPAPTSIIDAAITAAKNAVKEMLAATYPISPMSSTVELVGTKPSQVDILNSSSANLIVVAPNVKTSTGPSAIFAVCATSATDGSASVVRICDRPSSLSGTHIYATWGAPGRGDGLVISKTNDDEDGLYDVRWW